MKKILVTGAAGYIGRHVVKRLLKDGFTVLVADLDLSVFSNDVIKISRPIFGGEEDIFEQMEKPDVCIHLAWKDGFRHNSHEHMKNLTAHYVFISNMLKGGLKQIVVMGTMHEIGYWEGEINENTPANPMSYYGIAKNSLRQATEVLCKEYGAVYQWLRAYYITGDDQKNHSIFAKIIEMEQSGEAKFPFNSGKNKYDFLNIDELGFQIASVAEQDNIMGVINCCSGRAVTLAEKVEEFIGENEYKIRLDYGAFPDREYDSPEIWGNREKIAKILEERSL